MLGKTKSKFTIENTKMTQQMAILQDQIKCFFQ
jgi:hypothetical protein